MSTQRVVITGMGVVSSIGQHLDDFRDAIKRGELGARPATMFNTQGFESAVACEVKDFTPDQYIKNTHPETIGRSSQFSIAATDMAISDAGLTRDALEGGAIPVSIGTTDGESQSLDKIAEIWAKQGIDHIEPDLVDKSSACNLSNAVSREFGFCGESVTISTACSAGNYAIGHAFDILKSNNASMAICGGSDSVCRKTYSGFSRLGTIAPEKCQPFDLHRKGILTGEGSGILVLETLESALARGARIYAEVLGYGLNCDANHMVAPNMNSVANCIRLAHRNAGVLSNEVDYICAHGTGTVANDEVESGAIHLVFGKKPPPVSSIKSMLGHTMGAASAIASIACVLAISDQFLPPTISHKTPDARCVQDCVPNVARNADVRIAQNNGFAFGGNNAITVYGQYSTEERFAV